MFNRYYRRISLICFLAFSQFFAFAQDSAASGVTSFDSTMRSHDKIYVVMSVCIVILVVMILYLVRIDAKISRKEKQNG